MSMNLLTLTYLLLILMFSRGCDSISEVEEGIASYYADFFQGQPTASGVLYDSSAMTAAHQSLPFGTEVRVTNLMNEKSVILTINDRGPFVDDRIIDVSKSAARKLEFIRAGIIKVRIEVLQ